MFLFVVLALILLVGLNATQAIGAFILRSSAETIPTAKRGLLLLAAIGGINLLAALTIYFLLAHGYLH